MLIIPIKPEPASRIRSGRKWFELRKTRPPQAGTVYLLETSDGRQAVDAIRTCIITENHLSLPIEELWKRVGTFATSRPKFDKYFGGKYKYGVAIPIKETQILAESVDPATLQEIDSTFRVPEWPWTYYEIDDDSPAGRYLASISRKQSLHPPPETGIVWDKDSLTVRPMRTNEADQFTDYYGQFVEPYYKGTEGYVDSVLASHVSGFDQHGYLTTAKTVWAFLLAEDVIGFTVATLKRGGSVKFGPTIIHPSFRGLKLGSAFRLLVEDQYPNARKFYNTLPAGSDAALKYVLQAGYRIEAHLEKQYGRYSNELVVGKVRLSGSSPPMVDVPDFDDRLTETPSLSIENISDIAADDTPAMLDLLANSYANVDASLIESLRHGLLQEWTELSRKPKRVLVARAGKDLAGIAILTPKRGGAVKCSPIASMRDHPDAIGALLHRAIELIDPKFHHKLYIHLPVLNREEIRQALARNFVIEGILREPYREGVDMVPMGRIFL